MNKAQLEGTRTERRARTRPPRAHTNARPIQEDLEMEETVAELSAELGHLERLAAQADHVRAQYARDCAAIAQTDTEYFRVMCKILDPLVDSFPQHPLVRKWTSVRKIWQNQLLNQN